MSNSADTVMIEILLPECTSKPKVSEYFDGLYHAAPIYTPTGEATSTGELREMGFGALDVSYGTRGGRMVIAI